MRWASASPNPRVQLDRAACVHRTPQQVTQQNRIGEPRVTGGPLAHPGTRRRPHFACALAVAAEGPGRGGKRRSTWPPRHPRRMRDQGQRLWQSRTRKRRCHRQLIPRAPPAVPLACADAPARSDICPTVTIPAAGSPVSTNIAERCAARIKLPDRFIRAELTPSRQVVIHSRVRREAEFRRAPPADRVPELTIQSGLIRVRRLGAPQCERRIGERFDGHRMAVTVNQRKISEVDRAQCCHRTASAISSAERPSAHAASAS